MRVMTVTEIEKKLVTTGNLGNTEVDMDTKKYAERVKSMYNECAKSFSQYMGDRSMSGWNKRMTAICRKYDAKDDVKDLLLWWSMKVNVLNDAYTKEDGFNA